MALDLVRLSRTLAYALRHQPSSYGIFLDEEGWVSVDTLLTSLRQERREWQGLSVEDLAAAIDQAEKKRYEMRDGKIRAYYGHSLAQKMVREPAEPPEFLFHITTPGAVEAIKLSGLQPMRRQHVHLSEDHEAFQQVASRRTDQPVILKVEALQAHQHGINFYVGNDTIWLAEPIPPTFIIFP